MNREILFRGQTRRKGEYLVNYAGDKCDSNWVYGGIFPQNEDGDKAIIYQQEPKIKKIVVYADTVGEYAGKHDIYNQPIFEGDIVNARCAGINYNADVQFRNGAFGIHWVHNGIEHFEAFTSFIDSATFEVIGNIYDNPELLEV